MPNYHFFKNKFVLQALKNYNETTEEKKVAFETLKTKDEKSAKEIEGQMRKLQRIQVCLHNVCYVFNGQLILVIAGTLRCLLRCLVGGKAGFLFIFKDLVSL